MEKFIAAAIQMDSTDSKSENLSRAAELVGEAARRGAKLVAMPENMNYAGPDSVLNAEDIPGGKTFRLMSELAVRHKIWLHCGSIYEINPSPVDARPFHTTLLFSPDGMLAAKYRKLHMFDVDIRNGPSVRESSLACPGDSIVTLDTGEIGHLGFSICYDIRFPEMYRLMALAGAQLFFTPANFTMSTGKDHWEPILRARAIENACYVVAPAQIGVKSLNLAYGRSLIVDPWGNVLAKAPDRPCVVTAEIDLDMIADVRAQLPMLQNRRGDVYRLSLS
jgi:predicted amidohydrolase